MIKIKYKDCLETYPEFPRSDHAKDQFYFPKVYKTQELDNNEVGKRFDGGLKVSLEELPTFINHLFWLVRCNAALPIFHFIDDQENIVGSLCQHGNVHISTFSASAEGLFGDALSKTEFIINNGETCYSTFTRSSKISGRKTPV